jgi:hypothetical protein
MIVIVAIKSNKNIISKKKIELEKKNIPKAQDVDVSWAILSRSSSSVPAPSRHLHPTLHTDATMSVVSCRLSLAVLGWSRCVSSSVHVSDEKYVT